MSDVREQLRERLRQAVLDGEMTPDELVAAWPRDDQGAEIVQAAARQRAVRSDAGSVRLTARDMAVFRWLTEMKAVYEADLRILLGRLSGRGGAPSMSAVRQVVLRWQKAGYVRAKKLLVDQPRIVWLLPAGAALLGEVGWKETSAHTSLHQAEVARVRLWMEKKYEVREWESERRFRQRQADKWKDGASGMHVPDGVVTFENGTSGAVEVERSEKQRSRLTEIIERLTTANSLTIYAIAEGVDEDERRQMDTLRRQVRTAYEDVKKARKTVRTGELVIWDYPSVLQEENAA